MVRFMALDTSNSFLKSLFLIFLISVGSAACGAPSDSSGITSGTVQPFPPESNTNEPAPLNGPAPLGAGFTEIIPSPDSRIIYVSSSGGSDASSGQDESNPVQSISRGISLLRDGFPDWLLLRKGDTWYEGLGQWKKSGRSPSEPMVVSAYGPSTVRPILKTGSGPALTTTGSGNSPASMDYLVVKGLHFYAHTRDPANTAEYTGTNGNYGIRWLRGSNYLLIEDNQISFYETNIAFDNVDGFGISNVYIRNNIITDSYNLASVDHAQGIYMSRVTGALIEGNIFDHNGWHPTIPDAHKTIYNHAMYIQSSSRDISVIDNIVMRSSSNGVQLRPGGQLNGNLMIENAISLLLAGGQSNLTASSVSNNVVLNGTDIGPGEPRGWGIDFNNIQASYNAVCENNIVASRFSNQGFAIESNGNVSYTDNIVHDWGAGNDTGVPSQYVDPDRSIESYSASVGGAGTRADFFAQLRAQSADNWNDDYSIANIKQYFRDGFALN